MSCIESNGNMGGSYWYDTIMSATTGGLAGAVLSTASITLRDLVKTTIDEKGLSYFITAVPVPNNERVPYVMKNALAFAMGGASMNALSWKACSVALPMLSIAFESGTVGLQAALVGAFFLTSLKGTINQNNWVSYIRTPTPENILVRNTMIRIITLVSVGFFLANAAKRVTSLLVFPPSKDEGCTIF